MSVIHDASTDSLRQLLVDNVVEGSTVITDGWQACRKPTKDNFIRERHVAPGRLAHERLPAVHRVASLVKRWMLSTHQGSVGDDHLRHYLDEFVFRFNRQTANHRGLLFFRLLEFAVGHDPVRYRQLVRNPRPGPENPPTPPTTRGWPPSLEVAPAGQH